MQPVASVDRGVGPQHCAFMQVKEALLGCSQAPRSKKGGLLAQRSSQPGARVPGDLEFREVAANPGLSELLGSGILAQPSLAQSWSAEEHAKTTRTSSGRQLLGSNPSRIKRDFSPL
ncbi:hypothetical protein HispidOSU_002825 [Sigmodon hispidus]